MKEITIEVPDNKLDFFLELVTNLSFTKIQKIDGESLTTEQQEFVNDLKSSLEQAELHQQGKIKLKNAKNFLLELKKNKEFSL
jgi:hypothetical protein